MDAKLTDIENAASGIVSLLRTMHWSAPRDVPAMRSRLRDELQDYVDAVMTAAPDGK